MHCCMQELKEKPGFYVVADSRERYKETMVEHTFRNVLFNVETTFTRGRRGALKKKVHTTTAEALDAAIMAELLQNARRSARS